jgi:aldehyde:ferredoxin oxidoreductase
MDCYEQGIITKKDTGGLDLHWGNPDALIELVKQINERRGIGNLLAEGVKRAAEKLGKRADKLAIHVKGLEGPAHDPRFGKTLALTYGTSNRGMCHIHPLGGHDWDGMKNNFGMTAYGLPDPTTVNNWSEEGKGKAAKLLQDCGILPDILGTCKFHLYNGVGPVEYATLITHLTGWEVTAEELLEVGERVFNLQRMFNVREGIDRKDDIIPERLLKIPELGKFASASECTIKDYNKMLDEYYQARGWSRDGIPEKIA